MKVRIWFEPRMSGGVLLCGNVVWRWAGSRPRCAMPAAHISGFRRFGGLSLPASRALGRNRRWKGVRCSVGLQTAQSAQEASVPYDKVIDEERKANGEAEDQPELRP